MQSLIYDRKVGKVGASEFARTLMDSSYNYVRQNYGHSVFPPNCHKNASVNSLALETDEYRYLLSGCADSSIKLWDIEEQTTINSMDHDLQFLDNEDYDNPHKVFKTMATVPRRSAHDYGVSCIKWWPIDAGMFLSGSYDHTIKVWDTNEFTPVHDFNLNNRVYSFDINSLNSLIATASDQPFLRLLDLRSTSSAHTLSGHKGKSLSVKWHPKEENILASGGLDGEVKIWDIRRSKSCLCRLDMLTTNSTHQSNGNLTKESVKAHLGPVNGLEWDPLGHLLYSAGNDDKIRVWDMISSPSPPINKLTNFGPLTRNKFLQNIPITLNYRYESELQYLIFPSDSGDIFIFRTIDGKLIKRLNRKGSKTLGRTCSIAKGAPFLNTFFCGTIDGEILAYSAHFNTLKIDEIFESEQPLSTLPLSTSIANDNLELQSLY